MSHHSSNAIGHRPSHNGSTRSSHHTHVAHHPHGHGHRAHASDRHPTFSKVFRWFLPEGHNELPKTVEIVGTFTDWERRPLHHEKTLNAWQITMHHIQSHRTHHYMLLVDGKPVQDKNSDGLAIPHGEQEVQFALDTHRGPRVFMLFAQSK